MADDQMTLKPTRQSTHRYPFISLSKAMERVEKLREVAGFNHAMANDARAAWGYAPKSSGGDQTIAALTYYGLIEDAGSGETRKVKISESATRFLRDERPEVRADLMAAFAMKPKAMQSLWEIWKHEPPSEAIARSILKVELGYSDWAAGELLDIYKDNLQFIPRVTSAIAPLEERVGADLAAKILADPPPRAPKVKAGDYVQWTRGDQDQFEAPKRVEWLSPDGEYVGVLGSNTGLPMSEVSVAEPPGTVVLPKGAATPKPEGDANPIEVFLDKDGRLQISANVDGAGLEKLQSILTKYAEILKLI